MSSAAATRTSTGNVTACPCRSNDAPQPGERVRQRRPGHGVLHLQEPHPARAGEHAVGAVDVLGVRELARGEAVESRHQARRRGAEPADEGERAVADQLVAHPLGHPPPRGPVGVGAVVALGGGDVGVREPVELDVVVVAVEQVEGSFQGPRGLDRVQAERGHGLEGHADENPERAEADPRGREDVGVLARRAGADGAVGGHELQRAHLVGEPPVSRRPCRACRWRWRPRRSARRCRRGWAAPSRAPTAAG